MRIARREQMNEERRREIPEGIVWLALLILLALAPLPWLNEENADQFFRILLAAAVFIFLLIVLATTVFPRGLRLPLGGWVLRIAPPAAYFVSYRSASRWLEDMRSKFVGTLDKMIALDARNDAIAAAISKTYAMANDSPNDIVGLYFESLGLAFIHTDQAMRDAVAAEIAQTIELLRQPAAPTTTEILNQVTFFSIAITSAETALRSRWIAIEGFMVSQDSICSAMQHSIERESMQAALAAIEAEVDEVTQPGRGRQTGSGRWTDDRIRELHAKYETRGSQTAKAFAKQHSIDRSYMYQRFRSLGLLY